MLDPLTWNRHAIRGVDEEGENNTDEKLELYGQCQSLNYGVLPFVIPLGCLFCVIITMTAVTSWKLKDGKLGGP